MNQQVQQVTMNKKEIYHLFLKVTMNITSQLATLNMNERESKTDTKKLIYSIIINSDEEHYYDQTRDTNMNKYE